jgi:hypothetical protein
VGKRKTVSENAIEGLVIPHNWDEKGKIIGIAIYTDKEEIYLVAQNRMEGQLLNNLHLKVGIQGKIMERLDGTRLIHVRNFQPILDESNFSQEVQQPKLSKED